MQRIARVLFALALVGGAIYATWHYTRPQPIEVSIGHVERGLVSATVANTRAGTVEACRRTKLAPASGGQVSRLEVKEGDRVETGQVLIAFWNEDRVAQLKLAGSETQAAEARILEACLNSEVARREAERLKELTRRRLVAEEQYDRANTEAGAREAACSGAKAALEVARARVDAARAALELTYLKAPFPGVVAELNAELGEFVTPSPPGIATLPAVDLIDDRCLYVTAPIDEVDAPRVALGMDTCISLDAFEEKRCGAKVTRIAPYVLEREKQARTVEVEVRLGKDSDTADLLPGYTADVEIVLDKRENTLRVPTEAVLEGHKLWVIDATTGTLVEKSFEAGLSNWQFTEVLSGLNENDAFVLSIDREGVKLGVLARAESPTP